MTRRPHARPVEPRPDEPLAELLLGLAGIVVIFALLFGLLPVMA